MTGAAGKAQNGRPLLYPPMSQACVIDIEASGFGRRSYPIEVGYVLPDGRSRCMLIRPPEEWAHWDEKAALVHGITRATLMQHGKSPLEVARLLNDDLAGMTAYCDGWAHDYAWLAALFEAAGMSPSFKLESVNRLLGDTQLSQLDGERRGALAEMGLKRHRASNDAKALQLALDRVVSGASALRQVPAPAPALSPAPAPAAGAT